MKLREVQADQDKLTEEVKVAFEAYDKDQNGFLDKREIRAFIKQMFGDFKIHFPLTDEFVFSVFNAMDKNHDNQLEVDEVRTYMGNIVNQMLPLFEEALASHP